jgi:histidine triad (HIT) family protein
MAFRDVRPVAPSHFLVIPKNRMGLTGMRKATKGHIALLGHLMYVASYVASQDPLLKDDGYRIVVNDGKFGCKYYYSL